MATTGPVKSSRIFGAGEFDAILNTLYPTPTSFDFVQDQTLTFKRDVKSLPGQGQFPADVAAGAASLTGKVTGGSFSGRMFSDLVIGAASNSQQKNRAKAELNLVGPDGTMNVKNHGAGVFDRDAGVRDVTTNLPFIRVKPKSDGTVSGHMNYAITANGKYIFDISRAGDTVANSYSWFGNITGRGSLLTITNQPQGPIGDFTALSTYECKDEQNVVTLNSCFADSAELNSKNGDYGKPPFSYMAQPDNFGNIGTMSFAQKR